MTEFLWATFARVSHGAEDAFNEWYDRVHLPEMLACPGWTSATRYRGAQLQYLALYGVEGEFALHGPEVERVWGWGPVEKNIRDNDGRLYRRRLIEERSGTDPSQRQPSLFVVRANCAPEHAELFVEWSNRNSRTSELLRDAAVRTEVFTSMSEATGVLAIHHLRSTTSPETEELRHEWGPIASHVRSEHRQVYELAIPTTSMSSSW